MRTRALIVILIALVSCKEEPIEDVRESYCGVEDPVNDLAWLKHQIDEFTQANSEGIDMFVYTVTYDGQPAFEVSVCCPACNTLPPEIFNCSGESLGRISMGIEADELTNRQLLWQTHKVCGSGGRYGC